MEFSRQYWILMYGCENIFTNPAFGCQKPPSYVAVADVADTISPARL